METQLRLAESTRSATTVEEEEEEEEKLENEVTEMANKVKEYRSTLPHHLNCTLFSLLSSLRPPLSLSFHLDAGAESCSGSFNRELAATDGERTADDVKLLNEKISSIISSMPKVLKRMNECISRIDRLVSSYETIHPTFKRKKS